MHTHTHPHKTRTHTQISSPHPAIPIYSCQEHHTCMILSLCWSVCWQIINYESKDASQQLVPKRALNTEGPCGVQQRGGRG